MKRGGAPELPGSRRGNKLSKEVMGWGAVAVGVLMGLTEWQSWNGYLNYLWAVLVLLWGVSGLKK
jgi:hypothetical protein|tara:strand:- start:1884 stop:2078 length:195 start_codon:yes stop_codon:yes gene_type:complete